MYICMYACMQVCIYMHFLIIHLHHYTFYNFRITEPFNIPTVLNTHKRTNLRKTLRTFAVSSKAYEFLNNKCKFAIAMPRS